MTKKILVADDSITIQKVIFLTLASEEYEVTTVGDGTTAIDTLKLDRPDLVVADVIMPGKNGYEVCRYVKGEDNLKDIPVLLLAGAFEGIDEEKAAEAGADGHIIKPFESEEFKAKIKKLLGADTGTASESEHPEPAPTTPEPAPAAEEPAPAKAVEAAPEAGKNSLTETIRKAMAKEAATTAAAKEATAEETTETEAPVEAPLSASTAVAPETTATTLPGEDEPLTLTQRLKIAMAREAAEKEAAEKEALKPEEAPALIADEETPEAAGDATPEAEPTPETDQAALCAATRDETAQVNEDKEQVKTEAEALTPEEAPKPEEAPETEEPEETIAAPDVSGDTQGKWNADDFVDEQLRQEAPAQEGAASEGADGLEDFDDPFADSFTDLSGNDTIATEQEEAEEATETTAPEDTASKESPETEEPLEAPSEEPEEIEAPAMAAPVAPAGEASTAEPPTAETKEADTPEPPDTNEELSKEVTNEEFMGLNPSVERAANPGTTDTSTGAAEEKEKEKEEEEEEDNNLGGEDIYGYDAAAATFESDPLAVAELGEPSDLGALGGLSSLNNPDEPEPTEPHPLEMPFEEEASDGAETIAEPTPKPTAESTENRPHESGAEADAQAAIAAIISREKIEEMVREIAKKVIEEVVWEVVPELSEQFIKTEIINKLKAAMSKIE